LGRPIAQSKFEEPQVDPAKPVSQILPTGGEQPQPLSFGEAAPDAVRLASGQGMRCALRSYRARSADRFGSRFAATAGGTALPVGMEELGTVATPARS
jgi:hypothetical protein